MDKKPRHVFEDALDVREFQELLEEIPQLPPDQQLETKFLLLVMGRLGLRPGEVTHITEEWVDWRNEIIRIPYHEPCECGYCRQQFRQKKEHSSEEITKSLSDIYWKPKSNKSARAVPFGFDPKLTIIMERYFDKYDEFRWSRKTVNRRITGIAELAEEIDADSLYPHALRASASSYHASRGLSPILLQTLMGWADIETAQIYVRLTGQQTSQALKEIHMQ